MIEMSAMNKDEVKAAFDAVDFEDRQYLAAVLLQERCPTAERRFNQLTKGLAKLLKDVKQEFPDACFYTAGGGLTLMIGPHHDERHHPISENVAVSASSYLIISDGDF